MDTGGSFQGVKRPGRKAFGAEVKNVWIYTSTPSYVFVAWCLTKGYDGVSKSFRTESI